MAGNRAERVARVIREEASRVILYELADPRIGFVTVTKVKVSGDLQNARIYVSVYGDSAERTKTMKALGRASAVVRRAVAPRLRLRQLPMIEFEFDESVEGAFRVEELIREARATDADAVSGSAGEADGDGQDAQDAQDGERPGGEGEGDGGGVGGSGDGGGGDEGGQG